jgi:hypothetical protein
MPNDEADIRELTPRRDDNVARIHDRWGGASPLRAELVREDEKLNRQTVRRIVELEARRSLPVLEQAAVAAERGQRLRSMAAFAEDRGHVARSGVTSKAAVGRKVPATAGPRLVG